jgi:predicted nicotinamide N-methyase
MDPETYTRQEEIVTVEFPGRSVKIREFDFHPWNANKVWPGNHHFVTWISENLHLFQNKRILELGSGTGALAIYLKLHLNLDITTSDYDDPDIPDNISFNCSLNNIPSIPFMPHTWGLPISDTLNSFDLIIASDILIYVAQYDNLISSIKYLTQKGASFYLSNRRRIDTEEMFLKKCEDAGFTVEVVGAKVFKLTQII